MLKNGIDPMAERRNAVTQAETAVQFTFRALAAEWHKEKLQGSVTAKTQTKLA